MIADRRAFALIELLAALAVTSLVLAGAVQLMAASSDADVRIRHEATTRESVAVDEMLLRDFLERVERDTLGRAVFEGTDSRATFSTRCERAGGWLGRCRASAELREVGGSAELVLSWDAGVRHVAGALPSGSKFVYRILRVRDVVWQRRWEGGNAIPDVMGLVMGIDTLLLPVGPTR
ncbi:MAG: prepilin-type N-terminal cleavage/methylation domain-containing protein [Gemmatimonadales bacterium]|nr:prepilin-type N-terminal cleavage/methylation domain-containing protein [Gemmatimonadales bacterium]